MHTNATCVQEMEPSFIMLPLKLKFPFRACDHSSSGGTSARGMAPTRNKTPDASGGGPAFSQRAQGFAAGWSGLIGRKVAKMMVCGDVVSNSLHQCGVAAPFCKGQLLCLARFHVSKHQNLRTIRAMAISIQLAEIGNLRRDPMHLFSDQESRACCSRSNCRFEQLQTQ